jgi:uncharacterized protein YecT (DUF1311 family)
LSAIGDDPTNGYFDGVELTCPGVANAEATVIQCNTLAYEEADAELNAVYKQLISEADEQEQGYLKAMQRAWIKLKEAQCGLVKYYHSGGRFSDKWKTRCEAVMTIRRVEALKALGRGISW